MKKEDIKWWHRIKLSDGNYTNGLVRHGEDGGNWPTTRFGIPADLTGKTVLDVGAWDGFFSFEAEKRNALKVTASDCKPGEGGNWGGTVGFNFAKEDLKSKVEWKPLDIVNEEHVKSMEPQDIVLCYGVLYHLPEPIKMIKHLSTLTNEYCLLETAVCSLEDVDKIDYKPGHENDPTNYYYPTPKWIINRAKENGFKDAQMIHNFGDKRATVKLIK